MAGGGGGSGWFQSAANVGILLGLVLVGGQMWQSNSIAAAQLFVANVQSTVDLEIALLGEKADESMDRIIQTPELATEHDYFIADRVHNILRRQLVIATILTEANLYGDSEGIDPEGFIRANHHLIASHYGIASLDQYIDQLQPAVDSGDLGSAYFQHLLVTMRDMAELSLKNDFATKRREAARQRLAEWQNDP